MENATKALIIAAAILIAIVVIALGVKIMSSSSDTTDRSDTVATTTSIQSFNAQFAPYIGTVKGKDLQNLLITVNTSNKKNLSHQVIIDGAFAYGYSPDAGQTYFWARYNTDSSTLFTFEFHNIDRNATYEVESTLNDDGYINRLYIHL